MADERIDIEITDKVDDNIERKILGIAKASDKGYTSVQKLKNSLKDINTTAVSKLAAASNSATNALAREMNATAKLTVARAREADSTARVAVATQKLATEQARTAAATLRAQAASDRAAAAKAKEANASVNLTKELEREANAKNRIIHDRNVVTPGSGANLGGVGGSKTLAAEQTNAMRRTPIVLPADVKVTNDAATANDRLTQSLGKAGAGAGLARHQMVNLGYQLQDIVVSLQAGQNPLTVFIQQGSQIAGIASASGIGLGAMTRAVWLLIAPFAPLIIALGAAYAGFKAFTEQSASTHQAELTKYANSLGLTSKEMRKLGNETVGANGKLKEFDTVTITMADSWNGFKATVAEGLSSLLNPFAGLTSYFQTAWGYAMSFLRLAFVGFYGLVVGGIKGVARIIANLPSVVGNTAAAIANGVIASVEFLINGSIKGLNRLIDGANPILSKFGKEVGHIGEVSFRRFARTGQTASAIIADSVNESIVEVDSTLKAFAKRWDENNVKAVKTRMDAAAAAIKANRDAKNGGAAKKELVDHTAENRAHALDVLNEKLGDELKRMKLLKPEREVQARFDQIENDLLQKKIRLTDAEKVSIMGKVRAIEAYKFIQAESDRIYEASVEPLRTYNATVDAAKELLAKASITQSQFTQEVDAGARKYKEATDPLFAMKEALEGNMRATGLYGDAIEKNAYAEQVRQAFLAKTIDLTKNATAADLAAAAAMIANNNALVQKQYLHGQIGAIVNPLLDDQKMLDNKAALYAEIESMRATDFAHEEQWAQAKRALDAKFSEMRLAGYSSMFGELAKLSSSGNSELAAIGKAAAVAQATIQGYQAVQNALATPAPWPLPLIFAAAAGVNAGAQVAGILSTNVGSFAQGGQFMVDGRAGVDNNNINMNVSRGERVSIETAQQQRAADSAEGGGKSPVNVKVVNVTDPKDIQAALADPENDHLVLNVLRRNPSAAKQLLGA